MQLLPFWNAATTPFFPSENTMRHPIALTAAIAAALASRLPAGYAPRKPEVQEVRQEASKDVAEDPSGGRKTGRAQQMWLTPLPTRRDDVRDQQVDVMNSRRSTITSRSRLPTRSRRREEVRLHDRRMPRTPATRPTTPTSRPRCARAAQTRAKTPPTRSTTRTESHKAFCPTGKRSTLPTLYSIEPGSAGFFCTRSHAVTPVLPSAPSTLQTPRCPLYRPPDGYTRCVGCDASAQDTTGANICRNVSGRSRRERASPVAGAQARGKRSLGGAPFVEQYRAGCSAGSAALPPTNRWSSRSDPRCADGRAAAAARWRVSRSGGLAAYVRQTVVVRFTGEYRKRARRARTPNCRSTLQPTSTTRSWPPSVPRLRRCEAHAGGNAGPARSRGAASVYLDEQDKDTVCPRSRSTVAFPSRVVQGPKRLRDCSKPLS